MGVVTSRPCPGCTLRVMLTPGEVVVPKGMVQAGIDRTDCGDFVIRVMPSWE